MIRKLEKLVKKLQGIGFVQPREEKIQVRCMTVFQEIKDNYREDKGNSLHKERGDRARGKSSFRSSVQMQQ